MRKLTNTSLRLLLGLLFAASLTTCGISSNEAGDQATGRTYRLFAADYFRSGHAASFLLNGSDPQGRHFEGLLRRSTGDITTFNGIQAVPVNVQIDLRDDQGKPVHTLSRRLYYSVTPHNRQRLGMIDVDDGRISLARQTRPLPETARIGDSGTIGVYTDTAGQRHTVTWRLAEGNNGLATLIILTRSEDLAGRPTDWLETRSLINADGECQSLTLRSYDSRSQTQLAVSATRKWL